MNNIEITNAALLKLGANPINSFDGNSMESKVAKSLYNTVKNMLLSSHTWRFAMQRCTLQKSQDDAELNGSRPNRSQMTEYNLPADFLRAVSAFAGDTRNIVDYEIHGGKLYSRSAQILSLEYIKDITENEFPHYFTLTFISRLAADFCVPLTDSTARMESLYRIAQSELQNARNIDSRQEPPHTLAANDLLGVRG